jgi:hypothetical protein
MNPRGFCHPLGIEMDAIGCENKILFKSFNVILLLKNNARRPII